MPNTEVRGSSSRSRKWFVLASLLIIGVSLYTLSGFTRSLGLHPIASCPQQSLSPSEIEARFTRGVALTREGMMGEYYLLDSIEEGLPLLKEAAQHGHSAAMKEVRGHFLRQGAVEMFGFDGKSAPDATAEGMMWKILAVHLGEDVSPSDAEVYRVLLDPEVLFPEGFFESPSGVAWMFQMLTESGLDWARRQAFAWRDCWPSNL